MFINHIYGYKQQLFILVPVRYFSSSFINYLLFDETFINFYRYQKKITNNCIKILIVLLFVY